MKLLMLVAYLMFGFINFAFYSTIAMAITKQGYSAGYLLMAIGIITAALLMNSFDDRIKVLIKEQRDKLNK